MIFTHFYVERSYSNNIQKLDDSQHPNKDPYNYMFSFSLFRQKEEVIKNHPIIMDEICTQFN